MAGEPRWVCIRLRPAPPVDPPFDDELPADVCPQPPDTPQLPLDWSRKPEPGGQPTHGSPPAANWQPAPASGAALARPGPQGSPARPDPQGLQGLQGQADRPGQPDREVQLAVHRFVAMFIEVLNGFRPPTQLRALATPELRANLIEQLSPPTVRLPGDGRPAATVTRMPAGSGRATPTPGRAAGAGARVGLCRLRICEPRDGVGEAAVVLHRGDTVWAMAVRLERRDRSWLCTAAETV